MMAEAAQSVDVIALSVFLRKRRAIGAISSEIEPRKTGTNENPPVTSAR